MATINYPSKFKNPGLALRILSHCWKYHGNGVVFICYHVHLGNEDFSP